MADENKSKDVLVHADHVKVYFKGKNKRSGTVKEKTRNPAQYVP